MPERKAARYWVAIASRDHVRRGVAGGFCQLGHGKAAPVHRLSPGDWIAYYSPRTKMARGEPLQAFTAIGRVRSGDAYAVRQGKNFNPVRRDVAWRKRAADAPIQRILPKLELTRGNANWGLVMRRSVVKISERDFKVIAKAMRVPARRG